MADRGYFKIEDIEACEKAGIEPYVPRPQRGPSVRAGLFCKDEFCHCARIEHDLSAGGDQGFVEHRQQGFAQRHV